MATNGATINLITVAASAAFLLGAITADHAYDPKAPTADLDARLTKTGVSKVQRTEKVGDKTVLALFFGERKMNNNYDAVDALRKAHNATATVFAKDGEEFVRVSTNVLTTEVLTTEGKRGIGTQLARNQAYEAVSKGGQYCGTVDVLGTAYDTCYNPIEDGAGKIQIPGTMS